MAKAKLACVPHTGIFLYRYRGLIWIWLLCSTKYSCVLLLISRKKGTVIQWYYIFNFLFTHWWVMKHVHLPDILGRRSIPIILVHVCEWVREYVCIWKSHKHVCCVCVCVGWCLEPSRGRRMPWCHVEIGGQITNVDSLLPLCRFSESNLGTQSWCPIAEQSCWSLYTVYSGSNRHIY